MMQKHVHMTAHQRTSQTTTIEKRRHNIGIIVKPKQQPMNNLFTLSEQGQLGQRRTS